MSARAIRIMDIAVENASIPAWSILIKAVFGTGVPKLPLGEITEQTSAAWVTILLDAAVDEGLFDLRTGAVAYGDVQIQGTSIFEAAGRIYDAIPDPDEQALLWDSAIAALEYGANQLKARAANKAPHAIH